MNKFSIYQYLLILVVLIVGSLYALPNLYPTQPSIQVAYTDSGRSADQSLLNDLENIEERNKQKEKKENKKMESIKNNSEKSFKGSVLVSYDIPNRKSLRLSIPGYSCENA